jgi:hypothetical protein
LQHSLEDPAPLRMEENMTDANNHYIAEAFFA